MTQNPLLGKRISLISKKNIRYEGLLYSINEQNATVALKNVRSYGTEGRERTDEDTAFVAPSDAVHPFLVFRGQDIKDLHVHENQAATEEISPTVVTATPTPVSSNVVSSVAAPPAPLPSSPRPSIPTTNNPPPSSAKVTASSVTVPPSLASNGAVSTGATTTSTSTPGDGALDNNSDHANRSRNIRRPRKPISAVGTGASLLTRKARGAVSDAATVGEEQADFDFQTHNDQFAKEENVDSAAAVDEPTIHTNSTKPSYAKVDFFDSISCDALDKQMGVDNRLRGHNERQLNTETFGAVALNNNSRRRGPRGSGGGAGGRGRGRGGDYYGEQETAGRGGRYGDSSGRGRGRNRHRGGRRGPNRPEGRSGEGLTPL